MNYLVDYNKLYEEEPCLHYVREKVDVYHRKFKRKLSWNWCAFVVPIFWFPFRKMYIETAVLCVITAVLGTFCFWLSKLHDGMIFIVLSYCYSIPVAVVCGVLGDTIYKKRVVKLIESEANLTNFEIKHQREEMGGVKWDGIAQFLCIQAMLIFFGRTLIRMLTL